MMHGYLVFDADDEQLVPFRTWRNAITADAARELTQLFEFNIPQRWSIAHLYQAILNQETHVKNIAYMTTLAGYVDWQLTGEKVLGIGDASGMFPIDEATGDYDQVMLDRFNQLKPVQQYQWQLTDILPQPLKAGTPAGTLTENSSHSLTIHQHLASHPLMRHQIGLDRGPLWIGHGQFFEQIPQRASPKR